VLYDQEIGFYKLPFFFIPDVVVLYGSMLFLVERRFLRRWMGLITAMFVNLRESISCGVGVFEYSIEESRLS
jgi:hypothetical protein